MLFRSKINHTYSAIISFTIRSAPFTSPTSTSILKMVSARQLCTIWRNVPTDSDKPHIDAKMRLTPISEPHFLLLRIFCAGNRWFYWLFAVTEAYSSVDIRTFLLIEVALQQALEGLAVTGLVAGHFQSLRFARL